MSEEAIKSEMFGSVEEVMKSLEDVQSGDLQLLLNQVERIGLWRGDKTLESSMQILKEKSDVLSNSCTKLAMVRIRTGDICC